MFLLKRRCRVCLCTFFFFLPFLSLGGLFPGVLVRFARRRPHQSRLLSLFPPFFPYGPVLPFPPSQTSCPFSFSPIICTLIVLLTDDSHQARDGFPPLLFHQSFFFFFSSIRVGPVPISPFCRFWFRFEICCFTLTPRAADVCSLSSLFPPPFTSFLP